MIIANIYSIRKTGFKCPVFLIYHIVLPCQCLEEAFDGTDSTMNPSFSITIPVSRLP